MACCALPIIRSRDDPTSWSSVWVGGSIKPVAAPRDAASAAVIDLKLGGDDADAVTDLLAGRGVPFVFTTGSGGGRIAGGHAGAPVLHISRRAFCRELAVEVTRTVYRADRYTLWVPVLRPEHLR